MLPIISIQLHHTVWYIEPSMGQDVFGENEAATSDGGVSEAPGDTAETSLHIMESGGEKEMTRGKSA